MSFWFVSGVLFELYRLYDVE